MSYKTSKDYERLWELIQPNEQSSGMSEVIYRSKWNDWREHILAQSKWEKEAFIKDCVMTDVEFIDPASQERPKVWHSPKEVPEDYAEIIVITDHPLRLLGNHYQDVLWDYMGRPVCERKTIVKWAYVDDLEGME